MENKNLENKIQNEENEKSSLSDYARKSVVGAVYRVGASFTMDAIYLSLVSAGAYYLKENYETIDSLSKGFSDFVGSLDPAKLARVATAVIAINFVDYKFDITNKLNKGLNKILGTEERKNKMLKQKYQDLYLELKENECKMTTISENIKTSSEFQEKCNWLLPAKVIYIKTINDDFGSAKMRETEDNTISHFQEGVANNYSELTDFVNKQNLTDEGFLGNKTFLDYFYERDADKRNRIENKFTFKCHRRNSEGKLWINQKNYRGDEEIYFIQKL